MSIEVMIWRRTRVRGEGGCVLECLGRDGCVAGGEFSRDRVGGVNHDG